MTLFFIDKTLKDCKDCMKVFRQSFGKTLLALFCTFLFLSGVNAQRTVTGTVSDGAGESLPGVSVVLVGASSGTVTNIDGTYRIGVPSDDAVLEFTFIGFRRQAIVVGGQSVINVVMQEAATELGELVVVGYGTQTRAHLTGSVSQISSQELMKAPMQNVSNLLTGKMSGLTSIQRSGQPGADGTELLIRGMNTFSGSNSPMIIVDGVPRTMDFLNPNDIETVTLLKDAAAAIYGVQGAGGVILITTKTGSEGAARISYDGSYTFTQNTAMPEYLNATDYMYWHNKARALDGLTPLWTADIQNKALTNDPNSIWGETDWLGKIFRLGSTQQHNISASGGTDKVKYFTSIGYMDQEGTLINTSFTRYNVRTNLDIQVAKNLRFTTNLAGYRTERDWPGYTIARIYDYNPIARAIRTIPIIKSEYQGLHTGWMPTGTEASNGYAAATESGYKRQARYNLDTNFMLEYDFSDLADLLKGLKIAAFASYNYGQTTDRNFDRYYRLYYVDIAFNEGITGSPARPISGFERSSSYGDNWMFRPQISYSREFRNKHNVSAMFLLEKRKSYSSTMTTRMRGYIIDYPIDISLGDELNLQSMPSGSHHYTGQQSYVGRINYAYGNKYLVEALFRTDWSYRFAPENRRGFFPSASVGWVVSQENFFANMLPIVDFLKLRASYGQAGKDNVRSDFMYNSSFGISRNAAFGGSATPMFYLEDSYIVRNLTWSTTHSFNIGVDANIWSGLLGVELDIFYQYTDDIIESASGNYPPSLGGYFPTQANSGSVDNRGFELTLKHANRINEDWSYAVRGNFSFARNKVLKRTRTPNYPSTYRPVVGAPINARHGFQALGLFQTQEEIDNYTTPPSAPDPHFRLGDIKYLDRNGDGRIDNGEISSSAATNQDYVVTGYGDIPEINFALNLDVSYKNFYVSMVWQGVSRTDYELSGWYDDSRQYPANTAYTTPFFGNGNAPYYIVENAWTPENPNARFPRLSTQASYSNGWRSSWWVINGEYLRLKNMNIGYNVPAQALDRTPFSRINIYLAGTNLLTFSHFKYVDPESPSVSNGHYPQQKTYSVGVNLTF